MKRKYHVTVWDNHGYCYSKFETATTWRIRVVALYFFRRYFCRAADWHWHKDGFMAEARDKIGGRGCMIQVEQINAWCPYTPYPVPALRSQVAA
jgi:hypothetical protein